MLSNYGHYILWMRAATSALAQPNMTAKDAASLADGLLKEADIRFTTRPTSGEDNRLIIQEEKPKP